jgi:aryl-alcohol dehydrogenase-like predicted oxidoreductase
MKYGNLPGIDKPVSRIVQGSILHKESAFPVMDAVCEQGCTALDTARVYGNEELVGRWISSRGIRDTFVVITKGGHCEFEKGEVTRHRCDPASITEDILASLDALDTGYIDLFILHRDDPRIPVSEIVDVLNEHRRAGRVRAFGGSNWHHGRIDEANRYAKARGLTPFACSNPQFSLAEMYEAPWPGCVSIGGPAGREARKYCARHGNPVFSWSSLAMGFLSGKFTRGMYERNPDDMPQRIRRTYCGHSNFERLERARQLAHRKGVTIPQIAIAYLASQPFEVYPVISCSDVEDFKRNVEAMGIYLTSDECACLDLAGPQVCG